MAENNPKQKRRTPSWCAQLPNRLGRRDVYKRQHVDSFRDAMSAIEEGSAEFAVLPIENSTAGIVSEIYDLLVEFENYIVGEQILPEDRKSR